MTVLENRPTTDPETDVHPDEDSDQPSRHVRLRAVAPGDMALLHRLATQPDTAEHWRYRGATPDQQTFATRLCDGVLAQFVVERLVDSSPIGLVCAYDANDRDGYVYAAGAFEGPSIGTGRGAEAMLLLADHVFDRWSFRKIYFEAADYNYQQFASGAARYFEEEGRLRDHTFHRGRYWDLVIGSLTREGLEDVRHRRDPRRAVARTDDGPMDLDAFCALIAEAMEIDGWRVEPDRRLREDLGVDSLGALAVQDLLERDAGIAEFDLSGDLGTVREVYMSYLTVASAPR